MVVSRRQSLPVVNHRHGGSLVTNPTLLTIEKQLAHAHRSLWRAAQEAELMRDQGLCDDLYQLCTEVGRLNTDMLRRRPTRAHKSTTVRN